MSVRRLELKHQTVFRERRTFIRIIASSFRRFFFCSDTFIFISQVWLFLDRSSESSENILD